MRRAWNYKQLSRVNQRSFLIMSWIVLLTILSCTYSTAFAQKHSLVFKNYRITGHVYQTLYTKDWLHCVFVCSADTQCISYNFHQKGLCEFNSCAVDDMFDLNKWGVHSSGFVFQQLRDTNKVHFVHIKYFENFPIAVSEATLTIIYLLRIQNRGLDLSHFQVTDNFSRSSQSSCHSEKSSLKNNSDINQPRFQNLNCK